MLSMQDEKPGVRWIRTYWDEGDVLSYLELDEDGWAVRQVELEGLKEYRPLPGREILSQLMFVSEVAFEKWTSATHSSP